MTYCWSSRLSSRSIVTDGIVRRCTASVASGLVAACMLFASPAHAIVTTIDFTGSTPYVPGYYYGLTNSLTGTSVLPAMTIAAGDTIQGTVSFASAIAVPTNSYLTSQLAITEANGPYDSINYTATLSYFNGSTEVTPAGIGTYGASTQGLVIGNYAFAGIPGFTFDSIRYSVTVDSFFDQDNQLFLDRGTLVESGSSYYLGVIPTTSAAPEPGTWAMMIAGFGMVGAGLRTRRKLHVAFA